MAWLNQIPTEDGNALRVALVMASFADSNTHRAEIARSVIKRFTGLDVATISHIIDRLGRYGVISHVKRRQRLPSIYTLAGYDQRHLHVV
jgi:hypothetical protein